MDSPEAKIRAIDARLIGVEREIATLRQRAHEHTSQIGGLKTLAEVGGEQRAELIRDVARLGGSMESGFRELKASTAAEFAQRDESRWRVQAFTISTGAALGALVVQLVHGL